VLRRIFGSKRNEIIRDLRKLHNEKLHKFIIRTIIRENEMGRECSTHRKEDECIVLGFWWKSQKERDHAEGLDVRGRIILKWISGIG
jgi:hypothetical protein